MKKFSKKDWPGLPKWPGIITIGDTVTLDQAKEIIIRTDGLYFCTNDRDFSRQLYETMGIEKDDWGGREGINERIDALNLEYLDNSQICSSYVGGPHGWCNWQGKIVDYGRNVGKWPDCEVIHDEWKAIAKAFPFLSLKSQLFNMESCQSMECGFKPVIEYHIKNGKVIVVSPEAQLLPSQVMETDIDITNLFSHGRERGCTIEQFKEAFEFVLNKPQ